MGEEEGSGRKKEVGRGEGVLLLSLSLPSSSPISFLPSHQVLRRKEVGVRGRGFEERGRKKEKEIGIRKLRDEEVLVGGG